MSKEDELIGPSTEASRLCSGLWVVPKIICGPVFAAVTPSFFDFAHLVGEAIIPSGIVSVLGTVHLSFYVLGSGLGFGMWNIVIIQPTYPTPHTPIPHHISTPSTHAGLHTCTGIAMSRRSGGMSYREDWLIGRDTNISHFRLRILSCWAILDLGCVVVASPIKATQSFGGWVSLGFGWCSGGRESLWRVWCVQKVPLEGRTRLTGWVQGRKEELTQSVLSPSVPTPPSNLLDRISCCHWRLHHLWHQQWHSTATLIFPTQCLITSILI